MRTDCIAYKKQLTMEIPVREKKMVRKIEDQTVLLIEFENQIAIQKREKKGVLKGMYEFPNIEGKKGKEDVIKFLEERGLVIKEIRILGEHRHIFTHKEWHMIAYLIQVQKKNCQWIWCTKKQLEEQYPLPTAFQPFFTMSKNISL